MDSGSSSAPSSQKECDPNNRQPTDSAYKYQSRLVPIGIRTIKVVTGIVNALDGTGTKHSQN